LKVELTFSNL